MTKISNHFINNKKRNNTISSKLSTTPESDKLYIESNSTPPESEQLSLKSNYLLPISESSTPNSPTTPHEYKPPMSQYFLLPISSPNHNINHPDSVTTLCAKYNTRHTHKPILTEMEYTEHNPTEPIKSAEIESTLTSTKDIETLSNQIINDVFKSVITELKYNTLNTGDLIFFCDERYWYNRLIDWATNSDYCHIGMILRDPVLYDKSYKGLYIIHSTSPELLDIEDHKYKMGVQITKFEDTIQNYEACYIRQLDTNRNDEFYNNLKEAYRLVHDVPYDFSPKNWLVSGFYHLGIWDYKVKRHTNAFWCSALVGYLYVKLGLLSGKFDWSNRAPCDFSDNKFILLEGNHLKAIEELKK